MNVARKFMFPVLLGCLAAMGGCSPDDQANTPNPPIVIEPNLSVGPIHAGMTTQQVVAQLGEPQHRTATALEYTRLGLAALPDTNGLIQAVMCGDVTGLQGRMVKAFNGRTPQGIGMNSTRDEVIKALGEPSSSQRFPGGVESLGYQALGLTLTLEGGKVHHMIVRFPSSATLDRSVNLEPAPK